MKRLIKRYVLKAQVDRESDEVNEGENSLSIRAPHSLFGQGLRVCTQCVVKFCAAVMELYYYSKLLQQNRVPF